MSWNWGRGWGGLADRESKGLGEVRNEPGCVSAGRTFQLKGAARAKALKPEEAKRPGGQCGWSQVGVG